MQAIYEYTLGTSALAQLLQAGVLVVLAYAVLMAGKSAIDAIVTYAESSETLLPYLYDGPQVVFQNPNQTGAITVYPSVNAPAGLEFSYSCYLLINKSTFQGRQQGLRHVFHKGSPVYKPLMCPGVFVRNDENTLVVHMNEAAAWNTFCEIPNIPVGKFFHLAIVVRNMAVDVYINGNVAHRLTLSSVPKQNFGDLYVFKTETFSDAGVSKDTPFQVLGAATGLISKLQYNAFALNFEQIDRLVRAGPSTKLVSATQNLPPYLADDWWVTYYSA
ncbi:hypothetical protein EBZ80_09050 [bacterium]|nr:hypothetical protein [bacterium]